MGHTRIGTLPRSRRWREVIELISSGAAADTIADASARAMHRTLVRHADDAVLHHAFYLLTQIPIAARSDDPIDSFRRLGLLVGGTPALPELGCSLMEALDRLGANAPGSDLGELAKLAAVESLDAVASRGTVDLFGASDTAEATARSLAALASPKRFGELARDFLARLLRRCLDYYLSRELPDHLGEDRRLGSLRDCQAFEDALRAHCHESARIAEAFAGEWFSKTTYEGGITPQKAGGFIRHAFTKLNGELARRGDDALAAA